jgi:release factor H-coupled RctB family protein
MGNSPAVGGRAPIHAFYSTRSWIEGNATQQLEDVAALPGIRAVAGMPDLHPGKYGPVGCSILAEHIHPQFVGSDIGCGMGLFQLDLAVRKLRVDKAAERLRALDAPWDGDVASALGEAGLASTLFDASLGTIGGGNHFCELQAIEEIFEPEVSERAGLDRALAYVLVHSGSRGLGYSILQRQLAAGTVALDCVSEAGSAYLAEHDVAVRWAALNRSVIAVRAAAEVRAKCSAIADLSHNLVEVGSGGVLHRKGTAPADRGLVPIPGSRGTLSYLVEPLAAAARRRWLRWRTALAANSIARRCMAASAPARLTGPSLLATRSAA